MQAPKTVSAPPPSVVAPGNHDGVHLGHRALVDAARNLALNPPARVVALTFDPHPAHVMAKDRAPPLLTTPARRAELLRGAGVDEVVVWPFDAAFAALSPEAFVDEVLVRRLGARAVVVGADFRFGASRIGDVARLASLGESRRLEVVVVPPVTLQGMPVSSSQVRKALAAGDVALAARMLARLHDLELPVVQGDQVGRTLGFPTANLDLKEPCAVADGVYAVVARFRDGDPRRLLGVANLGVRPTRGAGRSMEVHLLDFSGDLYGQRLRVGFAARLRGEIRFPSLDALRAQIGRDIEEARAALAGLSPALCGSF